MQTARALTQHFPDVRSSGRPARSGKRCLAAHAGEQCRCDFHGRGTLRRGLPRYSAVDVTARVIMTTAYDNYAVRAFEVNSIDYLLKTDRPRGAAACRGTLPCAERGIDFDVLLNAIRSPREYKQTALASCVSTTGSSRCRPPTSPISTLEEKKHLPCHERQQPVHHGSVARRPFGRTGSRAVFPHIAQLHHRHAGDRQHREYPATG